MRSGFVSIIGRPNVGKSTLVNTIINRKVAITSDVSGTTRNIIQGIYNDVDSQIVFVDTPGIHKPINKLGKVLNKEAVYRKLSGTTHKRSQNNCHAPVTLRRQRSACHNSRHSAAESYKHRNNTSS